MKNWGGKEVIGFCSLTRYFLLFVPNYGAKFHQNRVRFTTVGEWTDRQTDVGDFITFHATIAMGHIISVHVICMI